MLIRSNQIATKSGETKEVVHEARLSGTDLPNLPTLNKGTAFTEKERSQLSLHGLLPPCVESLVEQVARAYEAYQRKEDDLERHIYLRTLEDTNEVLF
jgi:malate dehydrogenase (oxaloacetate-decarboxylating)